MKILIVSPTQKGMGGIAQHVQGLSNFLNSHGNEVEIISSENTFTIPVKGLKNPSFMISSFLKTKLKKKFDIIHAHNMPAALSIKNTRTKRVLSIHGIFSKQIKILHGNTISKISEKYEKNALSWADVITVVSKEALDYYTKLGFEVVQVPNAIDLSKLSQEVDKRYKNQIVYAGRLSKEKGIETLLEVAKKLPDEIHLLILGSGPEQEKIIDITKSKENIHYLGFQKKIETLSIIRGSDVLIQPSLIEGISSTLLESMACKTPIIATKVGGNKELINHNKTGILVESENSTCLLEEILNLISNKEKAKNLSNQAYDEVKKYDWNSVGNKYLSIYDSLLR